jgi:23S rRNA (uridine2552-2'-O)-methyltransferase|tara:strand:+ start:3119 stop:3742 length:624 start_codon:yes stop_codon:yes gene_type:complete
LKKNKISKNWINKQKKDIYIRKSKTEGYRSRAVYKLIEIDEKFKILNNGISVIDLGAAPGSWSQYISKKVTNSKIVSIDLRQIERIDNTFHIEGDFTNEKYQSQIRNLFKSNVDVVLSDMGANTTGNKNLDSIYTGELCKEAMIFSEKILKQNGKFVSKVFMGSIFNEIISEAKSIFNEVKVFKPKSSKKDSREIFIICKNLKKYGT